MLAFIIFVFFVPYTESYGSCFRKPSFVSNWTEIVAQNTSYSEITIRHGLGEIPVKVDVQVKAVYDNGTEDNFMFPGIGSAQRDDDNNEPYGGVVYIYDDTKVTLIAPNKHDGHDTGNVVYSGENVWAGPTASTSKKGLVQVRVWLPSDFPKPDYESPWINVQSGKAIDSVIENPHHLGTVPEYASIQVKDETTNSISDGIGSWLGYDAPNNNSSWGGVLYCYNKDKFRIFLPSHPSGSLFSAEDGWGISNRHWTRGSIKLRAWNSLSAIYTNKGFNVDVNLAKNERLQTNISQIHTSDDLIQLVMIPNNGSNTGFHYKASGAAQTTGTIQTKGYGGLVYSYSENNLRLYHPPFPIANKASNGVLLDISNIWGNSTYSQKTNYVKLLIQIWRPETCVGGSGSRNVDNGSVEEGGLSVGAGVGIAIGIVALLAGSAGLLWALLLRRKKRNSVEAAKTEGQENQDTDVEQNTENDEIKQEEDETNKEVRNVQQGETTTDGGDAE